MHAISTGTSSSERWLSKNEGKDDVLKLRSLSLFSQRNQPFHKQGALSMNEDTNETSHFQEVNGINLHYVTWGEFTREVLSFLTAAN